jgi:hypothetical protein
VSRSLSVNYRLARTVVKIDGTVSTGTAVDGGPETTWAAQVTIGCEADPAAEAQRTVSLDGHLDDQRKFELQLAADGRLSGGTESSSGVGVALAGVAVTAATVAAKAFSALAEIASVAPADEDSSGRPATIEEQFASRNGDFAARRAKLRATLAALDDLLIKEIDAVSRSQDPESLDADRQARLTSIEAALTATRTELTAMDTKFQSWKAANFPTTTETVSYLVGTADLPQRPSAAATQTFTEPELAAQSESVEQLRLVVVLVEDSDRRTSDPRSQLDDVRDEELVYRVPRPVEIAIYQKPEPVEGDQDDPDLKNLPPAGGAHESYVLSQVMPAWIIDRWSDVGIVPLTHSLFSSRETTVAFGDAGTLTQISNNDTPPLSGILSAIGAAGGQVTGALDDVSKVTAAFPAPATPEDPALTTLKAQVTQKELEARLVKANETVAKAASS